MKQQLNLGSPADKANKILRKIFEANKIKDSWKQNTIDWACNENGKERKDGYQKKQVKEQIES